MSDESPTRSAESPNVNDVSPAASDDAPPARGDMSLTASELQAVLQELASTQADQARILRRMELGLDQALKPEQDLKMLLAALEDAVGKVQLAMGEVRQGCARHRQHLGTRLESLEDTLGEQRLSLARLAGAAPAVSGGELSGEAALIHERLEAVEALLVHLGGTPSERLVPAEEQALPQEVLLRLEAVEALLVHLGGQSSKDLAPETREDLGQAMESRLEGIEAALSEVRRVMARGASVPEDGPVDTALELRQRVEALEGLLGAQDLRLRRVLDGQSGREVRLSEQLDALEAGVVDQRHALQRMVTTFDANAYSQRLEFQRRLADLMNNLVDQRQELHGQLAAIEAGFSDQRITLTRLASAMAQAQAERVVQGNPWEDALGQAAPTKGDPRVTVGKEPRPQGATPQPPPTAAAAPATSSGLHPAVTTLERQAAGAIEEKLGAVLDCLLADHVAGLARAGLDAGDLEQGAYQELLRGLDALKLERLRGHHLGDQAPEDKTSEEER